MGSGQYRIVKKHQYGIRAGGQRASTIVAKAVNDQYRRGRDQHPVWRDLGSAEQARLRRETQAGQYTQFSCQDADGSVFVYQPHGRRTDDEHACLVRIRNGQQKIIEVDLTDDLMALFGLAKVPVAEALVVTGADLAGPGASDADRAQLAANVAKIEAETEAKRAASSPPHSTLANEARGIAGNLNAALASSTKRGTDAYVEPALNRLKVLADVADRQQTIQDQFERDSTAICRTLAGWYISAMRFAAQEGIDWPGTDGLPVATEADVNTLLGDLAEDLRARRDD